MTRHGVITQRYDHTEKRKLFNKLDVWTIGFCFLSLTTLSELALWFCANGVTWRYPKVCFLLLSSPVPFDNSFGKRRYQNRLSFVDLSWQHVAADKLPHRYRSEWPATAHSPARESRTEWPGVVEEKSMLGIFSSAQHRRLTKRSISCRDSRKLPYWYSGQCFAMTEKHIQEL